MVHRLIEGVLRYCTAKVIFRLHHLYFNYCT
jgi:hypothetical protein